MTLNRPSRGKPILLAALAAILLGSPVEAEVGKISEPFDQRVRETLLRHPEILLEVFALLEAREEAGQVPTDREMIAKVADVLFEGLNPQKPILVEFLDYNCGYCRQVHLVISALRGENPELQLVVLQMPILGEGSRYAAEAALALKTLEGEAAYLAFSDALMAEKAPATVASVLRVLNDLGNDTEAVTRAIRSGLAEDALRQTASVAETLGIAGTPYFVGPGGIVRGAGSFRQLEAISKPVSPQVSE